MLDRKSVFVRLSALIISVAASMAAPARQAGAETLQVLANGNSTSGGIYYSALLLGPGGVLYATPSEVNFTGGTVLELKPPSAGKTVWSQTVLHRFSGYPKDGNTLQGAVIADKNGNLYGTTGQGGANNQGVVFKLTKPAPGKTVWVETILYSFGAKKNDASQSRAPLVFDTHGNLYGTTIYGGASGRCGDTGCGTVFKLAPPVAGKTTWTETVIHSFGVAVNDGQLPELGGVSIDAKGNLYGTAGNGGLYKAGMAFKLTPPPAGKTAWTETTMVNFTNYGGPNSGLIMDKAGLLYGALSGGTNGNGSIYRLTPPAPGKTAWVETILYDFQTFNDCNHPYSTLLMDKDGSLYGTAHDAGATPPSGTVDGCVYSLKKSGANYKEEILYNFHAASGSTPKQGSNPWGALVADAKGVLYGTTSSGGSNELGTVFKLTGSGFVP
jgi:uncharacterized repeat protein (TIGR03803 family)